MSIADDARTILMLEAFADEAKRLAGERRAALNERARKQLQDDGIAPSWHLPEVAKITLGVTKTAPFVADESKLLDWVHAKHPGQLEEIVRVRGAFLAQLLAKVVVDGDVVADPETGEIVPGIGVRRGGLPGNLSIKAEPGIKPAMAEMVTAMLATAHPAIVGPVEDAPKAPDDPWLPSGDPFAAFPARGGS